MKYTSILIVATLLATATASAAEPSFEPLLQECLPGMSVESIPDRQQAEQRLQDACFALGTPGREAEREAACRVMAGKLGPETAQPARIWLLKQLEFIGRAESVDAVAALLADEDRDVRDWARRALTHNSAPQANEKLLEALQQAKEEDWKTALVNSLGYRREPASVTALAAQLGDSSQPVAVAAAIALGKIAAPEAIRALETAREKAAEPLRGRISEACLLGGDRLLAAGKVAEAVAVYEKLGSQNPLRAIRMAAMRGRLRAAGDSAAPLVLEMLAGADTDARAIAAGHVVEVSGEAALKAFAEGFAKLPSEGKVLLLAGLAARGDKAAGSIAMESGQSDVPEVRLAGIKALAKLGDTTAVPLLVAVMSTGGDVAGPARASLEAVYGPGVDEAIVASLEDASVGLRANLIDVLDARHATSAVPALLQQAASPEAELRSRAVRTLGNIAQPEALPAMIDLLLKTDKGRQRDDLEKAIMLVAVRTDDREQQAAPVLSRLAGAKEAEACILLPVLGRIGGQEALAAVKKAMAGDNPEICGAAVRALCNWPDAGVAGEVMSIVEESTSEETRLQALRAYIRVISLPSDRAATETLGMLQLAMTKATRSDEKKLVLSRASSARGLETFRWVLPYLDDPELVGEASLAVVELAHHRELMGPNQQEFRAALKKVTEVCKNQGTVDRATRYLQGL